jgi:hypothetical protein
VKLVREFLTKVNIETGKSENRFNLAQLDQQLVFKNGEAVVRFYLPLSLLLPIADSSLSYRTSDSETKSANSFTRVR